MVQPRGRVVSVHSLQCPSGRAHEHVIAQDGREAILGGTVVRHGVLTLHTGDDRGVVLEEMGKSKGKVGR